MSDYHFVLLVCVLKGCCYLHNYLHSVSQKQFEPCYVSFSASFIGFGCMSQ